MDLIVIGGSFETSAYFGIAEVDRNTGGTAGFGTLSVLCANGRTIGPLDNSLANISSGAFVAVRLNRNGNAYTSVRALGRLGTVSTASWIGKSAVTYGGQSYTVPENVSCYNRDTRRWITLDQALNYSTSTTLYAYDGTIRIVEVSG